MAGLAAEMQEVGIEPVPAGHPLISGWSTGALWANLGVSFLVMVVGMFLVPGLSLGHALLAILVGAVIGNLLLGIASAIGSDVRVPTMVLLRAPLGVRGSYLPTGLNILQLLGWATLEVIVMAQAADVIANRVFGFPSAYPLWIIVFTGLTLLMAMAGPVAVTRRWLEKVTVWAALGATLWLTISVLTTYDLGALLARPGDGTMSFWLGVDLVVALPISWFPLVADFSRFTATRRGAFWGAGAGYFVPHVWFYGLGATLALAGSVVFDPLAPVVPLLGAIAALTVGWLALLVLLVVETDEAFANVYSTALSIQNLIPWAGQRTLIAAICAIVLVIGLLVPLTRYESFLLLIGAFFVPLLAVLAADYFVVQNRSYQTGELYRLQGRYAYQGGFNIEALGVWLVGIVLYLTIAGLPIGFGEIVGPWLGMEKLVIGGLAPWLGGTLPSFTVAFALHAVLGRLTTRQPAALPAGS